MLDNKFNKDNVKKKDVEIKLQAEVPRLNEQTLKEAKDITDYDSFWIQLAKEINSIVNLPRDSIQQQKEKKQQDDRMADVLRSKAEQSSQFKQEFKMFSAKKDKQQLDDLIKQMEEVQIEGRHHKYLNLFGVDRENCVRCSRKKCPQYRSNYNIDPRGGVEIFGCLECKCPMNSHFIEQINQSFSNELSMLLSNKYIESDHLNFRSLVAIFFVFPEDSKQHQRKLKRNKEEGKKNDANEEATCDVDLETFVQILNEGCFDVLSYYECNVDDLRDKLIQKKIYSLKQPVEKRSFDELLSFMISFLRAEKQIDRNQMQDLRKAITNERDLDKYYYYDRMKNKIDTKLQKLGQDVYNKAKVYVMLISSKYNNPYTQFRRFLVAAHEQIPKELIFYYSSKYKYKGIVDAQQFFPSFFQISVSSFILTQRIPQKLLQVDTTKYEENSLQVQQKIKKDYYERINDHFKDLLDFNCFEIVKENFDHLTQDKLKNAFGFLQNSAKDFLSFCQLEDQSINLKIAKKIGPPTLTQISANAMNFYRITDQFDNETICQNLCEELSQSQRVIIILRPIIVRSNIDELLLNIYRLNGFIIVKRVYTQLTYQEARLLAKLENITKDNIENYIYMMREGTTAIILMSKPGALSEAKLLAKGCESGLKLQKTSFLDELFIEHKTDSNVKFKEKISKEFYNVFQSYTNLNMFNGLQEFFNLEKLIFIDDDYKSDYNNMFINEETNQVFFQAPPEVKAKVFSNRQRARIMQDINEETYNFFVQTTKDELSTDQIVAMFMPDCAQITQIILIVKPKYNDLIQEIIQILQKLKYRVNEDAKKVLDIKESEKLINMLEILKLNQQKTDQLAKDFSNKELIFLSCIKPAGRTEMLSFLQTFSLHVNNQIDIKSPLVLQDLQEMLIPCWNETAHKMAMKILNERCQSFDGDDILDMTQEDRAYCIDFMLEITFGANRDETIPLEEPMQFQNPLYPKQFVHIKASSDNLGDFEIRCLRFKRYSSQEQSTEFLNQNFQLQSWYYTKINELYSQRAPITYQYRILPEVKTYDMPTHVFDCQEYSGGFFLEQVALRMKQQRKIEINPLLFEKFQKNILNIDRGSIISYLWGMKLAQFVKELEIINENNLDGFGPIIKRDNKFQGQLHEEETLLLGEATRYKQILNRLFKKEDLVYSPNDIEQITNKLDSILNSDIYKYSRQPHMRRILPSFVENENLRIKFDRQLIQRQVKQGEFEYFDMDYEKELHQLLKEEEEKRKRDIEEEMLKAGIISKNLFIKPKTQDGGQAPEISAQEQQQQEQKYQEYLKKKKQKQQQIQFDLDDDDDQNNKQNKEHKDVLNSIALVYTLPEIKSKYSLTANILYQLKIVFKDMNKRQNLTNNNEKEYEYLIKGLRKGYKKHYKVDQDDMEYMQHEYQKELIKSRNNTVNICDLVQIELFFICLIQIERNYDMIQQIEAEQQDYQVKQSKLIPEVSKNTFASQAQKEELERVTIKIKDLVKQRGLIRDQIFTLLGHIKDLNIYFEYEKSRILEAEQDESNIKVQIQRNKYFIPLNNNKNEKEYWERNTQIDKYKIDLYHNRQMPKDPQKEKPREVLLERYGDAVFLQNATEDEIQKKWFFRQPLPVNNIRPIKIADQKEFILVEKIKSHQQKSEQAINKVILKYKQDMGLIKQGKNNSKQNNDDKNEDEDD